MTWFRIDDNWADSVKVDALSDMAVRLWAMCGTWCSKKENLRKFDGFVPAAALQTITRHRWSDEQLEDGVHELVEKTRLGGLFEHGLWEPRDGGWRFHDWEQYRPKDSDEPTKSPSEAASIAGKASAAARAARDGTAQPKKPAKIRTDIERPSNDDQTFEERSTPTFDRTTPERLEPPDPDPGSDLPEISLQRPDRSEPAGPDEAPPAQSERRKPDDPMRRAMETKPKLAEELFDAYRTESGMLGAKCDGARAQLFLRLAAEGVTVEQVRLAVRGAKLDPWARDEKNLATSVILSSADQREKYVALARDPPRPKHVKAPRQPIGGDFGERFLTAAQAGRRQ